MRHKLNAVSFILILFEKKIIEVINQVKHFYLVYHRINFEMRTHLFTSSFLRELCSAYRYCRKNEKTGLFAIKDADNN